MSSSMKQLSWVPNMGINIFKEENFKNKSAIMKQTNFNLKILISKI